MSALLPDILAERIRVAAARLASLPVETVEELRGVFASTRDSKDGDAA